MKIAKWILGALSLAACILPPMSASAVSVGQTDTFEDGTTQNWVVGLLGAVPPFPPTNVPTGGPAGAGDNYLLLTSSGAPFLEPGNRMVVINQTQWTGNYLAAGVNFITMDVNNLGATDLSLRIRVEDPDAPPSNTPTHIAVSTDAVFVPAGSGWTRAVFPMSPAHFTALRGNATAALSNVAELRIYHSPTATFPGPTIAAQLGVDNIKARATPLPPQADFDGDGKADIAVWRHSDTTWYILQSRDGFKAQQWGLSADIPVPGDYDGDGKTDIAVWRPSDRVWYILQSRDGFKAQQWGLSADIPVPGDYDGDGKTDIAVWRPSDGTWYILNSLTGTMTAQPWGLSADKPVAGDYDGDGKTDIAVWRPSDATWYILQSRDGFKAQQWGLATDKPVPGDYDGDGKTDIAVWRPSDGFWHILRSSDGGIAATQWGTAALNDVPVPGDYDGDGKTDIAVWRPGNGTWYILRSYNFITMDVNNLGTTDLSLRIRVEDPDAGPSNTPTHIAVSTNPVFVPAGSGWIKVVFPMSPAYFTALRGNAAEALSNVAELRLFHSPTATFPGPPIAAQLGVDNITAPVKSLPAVGSGQTDNFEDGTTQNWVVGQLGAVPPFPPTNVPTGGPAGAGDNYLLLISTGDPFLVPGNRMVVINNTQWTGNYLSAAVQWGLVSLTDVPVPGDYDGN